MRNVSRALCFALMLSVTMVCMPSQSRAMLAPAQGSSRTDRAGDMKTIQTALESKVVRERLKALGLTDKEIELRLSKLSDQQLHKFAKDVDTLAAGGLIEAILVVVVLVLLILFLVKRV